MRGETETDTAKAEYLQNAIKASRDMPTGYARGDAWAAGPVGVHRDSDPLARSNYRVGLNEMLTAAGLTYEDVPVMGMDGGEEIEEPIALGRFGHWGVGWVEEILYRADNAVLVDKAYEIYQRLETYPVLDEEDWAEEEIASEEFYEEEEEEE